MKTIYRARNSVDAALFESVLRQEGIHCVVKGSQLESALGEVSFNNLIQVLVSEADIESAMELKKHFEQNQRSEGRASGPNVAAYFVLSVIIVFLVSLFILTQ